MTKSAVCPRWEEAADSVNMGSTKGLNDCIKNAVTHSLYSLSKNFLKKYSKT
jgi:short-subunit dehydrogenase